MKEEPRYLVWAEGIFEMYYVSDRKKIIPPQDLDDFYKRLDRYLQNCAERIAKDYYLESCTWIYLSENYFSKWGGMSAERLYSFCRYAFIEHRKDTSYIRELFISYPSLFLSHLVTKPVNKNFRVHFGLWLTAMDCWSEKSKKPYSLKEYWKNFTSIAEDFKV